LESPHHVFFVGRAGAGEEIEKNKRYEESLVREVKTIKIK